MAYIIKVGDVPIECETADDAIAIARKLAHGNGNRHGVIPVVDPAEITSGMDRSRLQQFVDDLSDHQKRLVMMIGKHASGISAPDLNKALGFKDNIQLGAHLSNISRNAQNHGFKLTDLWSRRIQISAGKKGSWEFEPSLHFRLAAKDLWDERTLPSKT
jgi:hypothetical protein